MCLQQHGRGPAAFDCNLRILQGLNGISQPRIEFVAHLIFPAMRRVQRLQQHPRLGYLSFTLILERARLIDRVEDLDCDVDRLDRRNQGLRGEVEELEDRNQKLSGADTTHPIVNEITRGGPWRTAQLFALAAGSQPTRAR